MGIHPQTLVDWTLSKLLKKTVMNQKKHVFLACFMGMLLFGISAITLGTMAQPLQERFDLDAIGIGKLFSVFPMGVLLGALLFGPVCDRYGYKYMLALAAFSIGIGFEGLARFQEISLLYAGIFLFGFGGGVINGATSGVVNDISAEHKGANLSILGVFFSVGAIGMPLLNGIIGHLFSPFEIVGSIGFLGILIGTWYLFVPFPGPREVREAVPFRLSFLMHPLLIFIAFFLFFQASIEGSINNWTTTFLTERKVMSESGALFGLSIHMIGMTIMRVLTGSVFRTFSKVRLIWIGLILLFLGFLGIQAKDSILVWTGLFFAGGGVALGFPLLLGFIGERFQQFTATAFSFVFSAALVGNMLLNYSMGHIIKSLGIEYYTVVCVACAIGMIAAFYKITTELRK